jgi:hypothetical protein
MAPTRRTTAASMEAFAGIIQRLMALPSWYLLFGSRDDYLPPVLFALQESKRRLDVVSV